MLTQTLLGGLFTGRARWLSQPISSASVQSILGLIADRQWVAEEVAVGRAAPELEVQRQLLGYGLEVTEHCGAAVSGCSCFDWTGSLGTTGLHLGCWHVDFGKPLG